MVDHENILTRKLFAQNFLTQKFPELQCNYYLYYSKSSLTNQIAPFEGNSVGYSTLLRILWQRVMTPDDNCASFECRVCVHTAQYSQWLRFCDRHR